MLNEENKPYPRRYYLSYLWTWYVDLFFWFWVGIVMHALWGTKRQWVSGCLCIEFKPESWPVSSWYRRWGGTTLGHTIILAPGRSGKPEIVDTKTEKHEFKHVHHYETMQLLAAILFCWLVTSGFEWQKLLVLPAGSAVAYFASMLQAFIRGESPYRDNIFEEAAYALD